MCMGFAVLSRNLKTMKEFFGVQFSRITNFVSRKYILVNQPIILATVTQHLELHFIYQHRASQKSNKGVHVLGALYDVTSHSIPTTDHPQS